MANRTGAKPLHLPAADDHWSPWLRSRCHDQLDRAREIAATIAATNGEMGHEEGSLATLRRWNDVSICLANAFAASSLMAQVHPRESLRTAAEDAGQAASRLTTELSLDSTLYGALAAVPAEGLDPEAARFLEHSLRDFRRAGVDRDEHTRERLRAINERETELSQQFSKNIRDDVRSVSLDPAQLHGLPGDYVAGHAVGADGRVTITTDYPDFIPFMSFATDRSARRALLLAFHNRAWPDNDALLKELLALRDEQAHLLGFAGWPDYDAQVKMIRSAEAIAAFIDQISAAAEKSGRRDAALLLARLQQDHPDAPVVERSDVAYYGELIRRERFDVDSQRVRAYLDFGRVRSGLLEVTGRLFGVTYRPVEDASSWHPDVCSYDVALAGAHVGRIHLDLHPRPGKYKHAAQFDLVSGVTGRQLPEGVLVCNFPRGLMEHNDVVTLFHEFGHLIHHVLAGDTTWVTFSGVSTEWDFVEAPSQLLEEWAWDPQVLQTFATDAEGAPIPAELVAKMRSGEEFGKGYDARTQMFYAAVSYQLHRGGVGDLTEEVARLRPRYDLFQEPEGAHFHASFGHLDGYSSAYYTYMWSLVIAKDLFSAFDRDDLFEPTTAHRYRDLILARGGTRDAADLVADFLGRAASFDAFSAWLERHPGQPTTSR